VKRDIMRLQVVKSKNSASFYIVESYRNEEGKSTSRIYKKLGNLNDVTQKANGMDPYEWGKEQARIYTKLEKEMKLPIEVEFNSEKMPKETLIFNVGYIFIQKIYYELKVNELMYNIFNDIFINEIII